MVTFIILVSTHDSEHYASCIATDNGAARMGCYELAIAY
jgi:hypothetical protein